MTKRLNHADVVIIQIDHNIRPMTGIVLVGKRGGVSVRIVERDPLWNRCVVKVKEAISVERCTEHNIGSAELSARWGVSFCEDAKRCPSCGTNNTIRRLDSAECLSCVMKTRQPVELPKPLAPPEKVAKKRGRPPKNKIAA